jgi:hypothetical protein
MTRASDTESKEKKNPHAQREVRDTHAIISWNQKKNGITNRGKSAEETINNKKKKLDRDRT